MPCYTSSWTPATQAAGIVEPASSSWITRITLRIGAVAYIGAGLTTRVLIGMLTNAVRLLGRGPAVGVRFVNSEEQAREYIETRRREITTSERAGR